MTQQQVEKRNVLAGLMVMFIAANLVSAFSTFYPLRR